MNGSIRTVVFFVSSLVCSVLASCNSSSPPTSTLTESVGPLAPPVAPPTNVQPERTWTEISGHTGLKFRIKEEPFFIGAEKNVRQYIIFRNETADVLTFNYVFTESKADLDSVSAVASGSDGATHQDHNFFVSQLYPGSESSGVHYFPGYASYVGMGPVGMSSITPNQAGVLPPGVPERYNLPLWVKVGTVKATALTGDPLRSLDNE